jgi:hypothetical protein
MLLITCLTPVMYMCALCDLCQTVLDLGLNDEVVAGVEKLHGTRFAYDCYRYICSLYCSLQGEPPLSTTLLLCAVCKTCPQDMTWVGWVMMKTHLHMAFAPALIPCFRRLLQMFGDVVLGIPISK